jgi:glycosyltransferase involved in cell wall biosynthesis
MSEEYTNINGVSIVIPAYNEEGAIEDGVRGVLDVMDNSELEYELIVVDDGSSDNTSEILSAMTGIVLISIPENRGYGASLKTGIRRSKFDLIVITDADGTYPSERIPDLIEECRRYDMVVGARIGEHVHIPMIRRPAKWVLGKISSYLAGRRIPDLNSGLRVMRKDLVQRFEHLLPSGFSFTTTITLASLCSSSLVKYVPIDYYPRIGESKIKAKHTLDFLILIIRTIVYFNPLKVFIPVGGAIFVLGFTKFIYDVYIGNFSETALLGFIGAVLIWGVGLLSDQISRVALRPNNIQ